MKVAELNNEICLKGALMNELIGSKELAKYLGISIRTLDALDKKGDLPASVRIGHLRRWQTYDVEKWISTKLQLKTSSRN